MMPAICETELRRAKYRPRMFSGTRSAIHVAQVELENDMENAPMSSTTMNTASAPGPEVTMP